MKMQRQKKFSNVLREILERAGWYLDDLHPNILVRQGVKKRHLDQVNSS